MKTQYYEDDIIEILNDSETNFIGQRFYIKYENEYEPNLFCGNRVQLKTDRNLYPEIEAIRLHHRPFKNHIKHLINLLLSSIK